MGRSCVKVVEERSVERGLEEGPDGGLGQVERLSGSLSELNRSPGGHIEGSDYRLDMG